MTCNNVILAQPAADQSVTYTIPEGDSARLNFTPDEISGLQMGSNGELVVSFEDGGQLTITNFEDLANSGNLVYLADGTFVDPSLLTQSMQAPAAFANDATALGTDTAATIIGQPAPNTTQQVSMESGGKYICDFDPANAATVEVKDGQMVLTFADGSQVIIDNYAQAMAGELPAELTVADGTAVNAEELLTQVTEVVEPIEEVLEFAQTQQEPIEEVLALAQESVAEDVANIEPAAGEEVVDGEADLAALAEALAGIETAAGEEGGATSGNSGYGFNSTATDVPLDTPDAIGAIGATQLGYEAPQVQQETIFTVTDDRPVAFGAQAQVDETSLSSGTTATGTVRVDFGNDTPGVITPNDSFFAVCNGVGVAQLFSQGDLIETVVTSNGYDGIANGQTVFSLTVDPATGDFLYEQFLPLDHPVDTDPNDPLCLNFGIMADDADGDTANTSVQITVLDDGPVVLSQSDTVVDETNYADGVLTNTGSFAVDMGQDINGSYEGSNSFVPSGSLDNGTLSTNGTAITVTYDAATFTYTGVAGTETVFTLTLDPQSGDYTYNQYLPLDHADASEANDVINLDFGITVIDFDGDRATGSVRVVVKDDAPLTGDDVNTISEADLTTGDIVINDSVSVDFGTDGKGELLPTGDFSATGPSVPAGGLTSNGQPVVVTETAFGYVGTIAGTTQSVFTLEINPETGDYSFILRQPLDHALEGQSGSNDSISLNFGTVITDFDGDSDLGTITINIDDSAPDANDDCQAFNTADGEADGNVITGFNGGAGAADDSSEGVSVTAISFEGDTIDVPTTGTVSIQGEFGVLEISSNGTYTYTLVDGAAQSNIDTSSFDPSSTDVSGTQSSITSDGITIQSNNGQDLSWFSDVNLGSGVGITGSGSDKVFGTGEQLQILFANNVNSAVFSIGDMGDNNIGDSFKYNVTLADGSVVEETATIDAASVSNGIYTFDVSGYGSDISQIDLVGGPSYVLNGVQGTTVETTDIAETFTYTLTDSDGDTDVADLKLIGEQADDFNPVNITGNGLTDDTNLADNNFDIINDVINVNYQGDGPGVTTGNGSFNTSGNLPGGQLTHDGQVVKIHFDADSNVYTGYLGDTVGSDAVFSLQVNPEGNFTFFQFQELDHSDTSNSNEPIFLEFGVTATDSDGDTGQGTVVITVLDDAPAAVDDRATVSDLDTPIDGSVVDNDNVGEDDRSAGTVTNVFFQGFDYPVTAGAVTTITTGLGVLNITSDGSYTYEANGSNRFPAQDSFTYTLRDNDGDTDTAVLRVNINDVDDTPRIQSANPLVTDETDLDPTDTDQDVFTVNFGNDGPGTYEVTGVNTFSHKDGQNNELTSNGSPVVVTLVGNSYVGTADGETVFVFELNETTGAYNFELLGTLDHNNPDDDNEAIELTFGVTAVDADGDRASTTIKVNVHDDAPDAEDDVNALSDDAVITDGNILDNDDIGADNGDVMVCGVTFGGKTIGVPETGSITVNGEYGNLTISADGSYTYERSFEIATTGNSTVKIYSNEGGTDTFTYEMKDSDGDVSSAELVVTVADDLSPININGQGTTDDTRVGSSGFDVAEGTISVNYQGDEPGETTGNGNFTVSGELANGKLTHNGKEIVVTFNEDKNTYSGETEDVRVFDMFVNPDATYTFVQLEAFDHANTNDDNEAIFLDFGVTATDSDGDTGAGTVRITVLDDAPEAHDDSASTSVTSTSEEHCFDPTEADVAGTQSSFTQDGITLTSNNGADLVWVNHEGPGVGIAGEGTDKVYRDKESLELRFDHSADSVELKIGDMGSNNIGNTFKYTVILANGTSVEETVTIDAGMVSNAVFTFDVSGYGSEITGIDLIGGPSFLLNGVKTEHSEFETVNAEGNVLANDDLSADDTTLVTSVTFDGETYGVTTSGTDIQTANGILTISSNGDFSYQATGTEDATNIFTYTITDADGDTSTAQLSIDSEGICVVIPPPTFTVNVESFDNDNPDRWDFSDTYNIKYNGGAKDVDFTINVTSGAENIDHFLIEVPDVLENFDVGFNKGTEVSDGVWKVEVNDISGLQIVMPGLEPVDGKTWRNPDYKVPQGDHDFKVTAQTIASEEACNHGEVISVEVNVDIVIFSSPLVLDLDGDGIELLNIEAGVQFDMDQDGEVEQTGWVGADDGFLALDKNGDGIINDRSELFGDTDGFSDGFDNLSSYDSNSDGVIDDKDDVYDDLTVWQDSDGDGETDAGEIRTLQQAGVASISLDTNTPDDVFVEGNWISHEGSYTTTDGEQRDIVDAWFETEETDDTVQTFAIEEPLTSPQEAYINEDGEVIVGHNVIPEVSVCGPGEGPEICVDFPLALEDVGAVGIFLNADMPENLVVSDFNASQEDMMTQAIGESSATLLALDAAGDDALDISQMLETSDDVTDAIQEFVHNTTEEDTGSHINDNAVEQNTGLAASTNELDELPSLGSDQIIV